MSTLKSKRVVVAGILLVAAVIIPAYVAHQACYDEKYAYTSNEGKAYGDYISSAEKEDHIFSYSKKLCKENQNQIYYSGLLSFLLILSALFYYRRSRR